MVRMTPARNASLLVPYALPLVLYVGIGSIPPEWGLARDANYGARLLATAAALVWAWRRYLPLRGPRSAAGSIALGAATGVVGTLIWIALKAPFYPDGGEAWSQGAFLLRLVASGSVVAVFEELLFRGFLLRATVQWQEERRAEAADPLENTLWRRSVDEAPAGAWTPLAVVVSTLAFAAGHGVREYPAALAFGLLMAALSIGRRDLLSCVVAHAVTNFTLALYVRATGQWALW